MNKLVYLFELDSIRNVDDQMRQAMRALYREIVMHGNAVAITFNQLIDSRFFLSLLNNEKWSNDILKLFESGAIRISQFKSFRTPSQYLLRQALDSSEEYVFSGLPIRSSQKSLIALAKRCLMYSDMTELNEYIDKKRNDEERKALFREQIKGTKNGEPADLIIESTLEEETIMKTLQDLKAVLNLIFQFSNIQNAYIAPKDFDAVKQKLTMYDFFLRVRKFKVKNVNYWKQSIKILDKILGTNDNEITSEMLKRRSKRSEVLKEILNEYQKPDKPNEVFNVFSLAEAIINLCYNYACEASICNVSRHYDINELKDKKGPWETFREDFISRLQQYYIKDKHREKHFLISESNDFKPYKFCFVGFHNPKRALHLSEYAKVYTKKKDSSNSSQQSEDCSQKTDSRKELFPYEYRLIRQRIKHRGTLLWGVGKKVFFSLIYLLIAFLIENYIHTSLDNVLDQFFKVRIADIVPEWIAVVIISFFSAALVEGLSRLPAKIPGIDKLRLKLPTFGDSIENFVTRFVDIVCLFTSIGVPYSNHKNARKLQPTDPETEKKIIHISQTVSDYRRYKEELSNDNNRMWMFKDSVRMPLMDIQNDAEAGRLTRIEEMTGTTYGIAYRSKYHIMVVDPLKNGKVNIEPPPAVKPELSEGNEIYPYERLAPAASKHGVVTIPILRDQKKPRFVLLYQYRHAVRKEQWCFPRGFGENGIDDEKNAQKELWEEIRAVLRNPATDAKIYYNKDHPEKSDDPTPALKKLGSITTDSGSLCDTVTIFQAELSSCDVQSGHEGIIEKKEVNAEELRKMIDNHEIDDSFTILAFMLWSETQA